MSHTGGCPPQEEVYFCFKNQSSISPSPFFQCEEVKNRSTFSQPSEVASCWGSNGEEGTLNYSNVNHSTTLRRRLVLLSLLAYPYLTLSIDIFLPGGLRVGECMTLEVQVHHRSNQKTAFKDTTWISAMHTLQSVKKSA